MPPLPSLASTDAPPSSRSVRDTSRQGCQFGFFEATLFVIKKTFDKTSIKMENIQKPVIVLFTVGLFSRYFLSFFFFYFGADLATLPPGGRSSPPSGEASGSSRSGRSWSRHPYAEAPWPPWRGPTAPQGGVGWRRGRLRRCCCLSSLSPRARSAQETVLKVSPASQ